MKIIAVLTTLFLPGTFLAVSLRRTNHLSLFNPSGHFTKTPPIDLFCNARVEMGCAHYERSYDESLLGLLGCHGAFDNCYHGYCGCIRPDSSKKEQKSQRRCAEESRIPGCLGGCGTARETSERPVYEPSRQQYRLAARRTGGVITFKMAPLLLKYRDLNILLTIETVCSQ